MRQVIVRRYCHKLMGKKGFYISMSALSFISKLDLPHHSSGTTAHQHEPFFGRAEEPEATKNVQKIGREPVAPTERAKAIRRRYSDEEKRRILRLTDACTERGQLGAVLRREGIYYTTLRLFQLQREKGQLDTASSPINKNKDSEKDSVAKQLAQLQRQNQRLTDRLEKAEIVIDFQKKLSRLLEIETRQDPDNF